MLRNRFIRCLSCRAVESLHLWIIGFKITVTKGYEFVTILKFKSNYSISYDK
jgi:hypothetical protein